MMEVRATALAHLAPEQAIRMLFCGVQACTTATNARLHDLPAVSTLTTRMLRTSPAPKNMAN